MRSGIPDQNINTWHLTVPGHLTLSPESTDGSRSLHRKGIVWSAPSGQSRCTGALLDLPVSQSGSWERKKKREGICERMNRVRWQSRQWLVTMGSNKYLFIVRRANMLKDNSLIRETQTNTHTQGLVHIVCKYSNKHTRHSPNTLHLSRSILSCSLHWLMM